MKDSKEILNLNKITIVITDSGLGGMSVCAGIEEKIRENKSFEEANLIFFNALPQKGLGYNSMSKFETKAKVFHQALVSMEKNFSPNLILIACNTLSIVYPHTKFSKVSITPVLGIVEFGTEMILREYIKNVKSTVMILGTQTTINSEVHKNRLIAKGIDSDRIICQSFPNLESEIQDSPDSDTVKELIKLYLSEAVEKLKSNDEKIIAALCCTHYGFSSEIFASTLKKLIGSNSVILNPNELMINSIIVKGNQNKVEKSRINVRVVSRAIIDEDEKQSIRGLINSYAPLSASALMNYEYNPNLFDFTNEEGNI